MARRRANGEGSISRRKDGRYEASAYFLTTSGAYRRIRVYAKTREEVHAKLVDAQAKARQGMPVADRNWKLGEYLDYWLEQVIRPNRRPGTYEQYEWNVRLYLRPGLGTRYLSRLSVPIVQAFLNERMAQGHSIRKVHIMREVLSSALGRAVREELVSRNVARLVELPTHRKKQIHPWSVEEAKRFLEAARTDPLYPAFLLLVLYGLRRGEALGLRWCDVDFS